MLSNVQLGPGKGPGQRHLDTEVVRVGGLSVPPLGVDVVDGASNIMCLSRNVATNALKVVGLPTLLPQAPGTRGDTQLASKMTGVFASTRGGSASSLTPLSESSELAVGFTCPHPHPPPTHTPRRASACLSLSLVLPLPVGCHAMCACR